jgi:phage terminase large subunit-like protein
MASAEIRLHIPELRLDQAVIVADSSKYKVVRCGRRWGKTKILETIAEDTAIEGGLTAVYAPQFATLSETYRNIFNVLEPIITTSSAGHQIRTRTGGTIDFWSLETGGLYGRGREYDRILIDEGAFAKSDLIHIWRTAISPTLWTREGSQAYVFSTPDVPEITNFFYALHESDEFTYKSPLEGFKQFYRPTHLNPLISKETLKLEKKNKHPLAFRQESLAEFVDWRGVPLFEIESHCAAPSKCDYIFAIIDSAIKSGAKHDGTAVMYFAVKLNFDPALIVMDWEIHQIDAALLKNWLPSVLERGLNIAAETGARHGFGGVFIEDKASGSILLQEAQLANMPAQPINSKHTSWGKDERARAIVNAVYQKQVMFSEYAFNKVMPFKGETKNHAISQITKYRIGDEDAYKRADDLFDTFAYGILQTLLPELTN